MPAQQTHHTLCVLVKYKSYTWSGMDMEQYDREEGGADRNTPFRVGFALKKEKALSTLDYKYVRA